MVEQQELDRRTSSGKAALHFASVEIEGLRPERLECGPLVELAGRHEIDRPETPRVVQREPFPLVRLEQQMIVLSQLRMIDPPASGHAKVEDHRVVAVGVDQSIFRPAAEPGHFRPRQPLAEVLGKGSAQVGPASLDARDPSTLENALKASDGRFDFGKLGHQPRYGERPPSPLEAAPCREKSASARSS